MNYIYDVILNFTNNYYYELYEWDKKDNLLNFKKIPIFYVNNTVIEDFINYIIKIDKKMLRMIENQSIVSKKEKINHLYSMIISNGKKSIGVEFDKNGISKYKSAMLLDEEEDVNRIAINNKLSIIKYTKLSFNKKKLLRQEAYKKELIVKELRKIYNQKEYGKLKYIYYEINNKILNDYDLIFNNLINSIDNNINKYDFLLMGLNNK